MTAQQELTPVMMQQLLMEDRDYSKIEEKLLSLGWDKEVVTKGIDAYKKVRAARRRSTGTTCIVVAACMGLISCILGIVNPFPELYFYYLYCLTSIAIGLGCFGLYQIFE